MLRLRRSGIAVALAAAIPPLAFLGYFFAWPLAVTAHRAVYDVGLAGHDAGIGASTIARAALTTVELAGAGTLVTLMVGLPAVWALSTRTFPGAQAIRALLTAPFVLPTIVVALAFLAVQHHALGALGAWHGRPAIVVAMAFYNTSIVVRVVGPTLEGLDARRSAAAATLGASPAQVLRHITWPAMRRSVAGAAAITFLFCTTSFALVLILGGTRVRTLETGAYLELTTFLNLRGAAILALVQALVVGAVAWGVERSSRGVTRVRQPAAARRRAATWSEAPRLVALLAPALAIVAIPLAVLVAQSVDTRGGASLKAYTSLVGASIPGVQPLGPSTVSSLALAAVAAAASCTLASLAVAAAYLDRRLAWVRAATLGPLMVSSVVIGVGILLALASAWRGAGSVSTYVLLICAQTLVALPLVVRILAPALDSIEPRMISAARALGAGPADVVRRIIFPLMRPALAASAGMAFAVAVGEFGASVFIAKPDAATLPTTILRLLSRPGADNLASASAAAVLLILVVGGAMLAAELVARRWKA